MLVKVPKILSHAQRRLVALIEERRFTAVVRDEYHIRQGRVSSLYRAATAKVIPNYTTIFSIRNHIRPCEWYFKETEELPRRIPYRPLFSYFDGAAADYLEVNATVGLVFLEHLRDDRKHTGFLNAHRINYWTAYNFLRRAKKRDGVSGHKTKVNYGVIRKLRYVIHPDYWYIFPGEMASLPEMNGTALL